MSTWLCMCNFHVSQLAEIFFLWSLLSRLACGCQSSGMVGGREKQDEDAFYSIVLLPMLSIHNFSYGPISLAILMLL